MRKSGRHNIAKCEREEKDRTMSNQNSTPTLPGVQTATVVVDTTVETAKLAVKRFDSVFALESEVVGKSATKRKVSKNGAVTMMMLPKTAKTGDSLTALAKAANEDVDAFTNRMTAQFKSDASALFGRISSSPDWQPKSVKLNADGNRVAFTFDLKGEPDKVVSEADAIKALAKQHNTTVEKIMEALSLAIPSEAPEAKAE